MVERRTRRSFLASGIAGAVGVWAHSRVRAAEPEWGDLVGRFLFDGKPFERKKLKVDKDVECCGKFDIRDESLMVGPEAGLANVFVYARSVPAICPELEKGLPGRVTLDNRDCIFVPHCLTLWVGKQDFYTVNSDPVSQNIAIEPPGDSPWNVVLPVKGDATYRFSRKQNAPVLIRCNYHPWESGYILPRDNPYAAISGLDGRFRIPKLPVGQIEFQVWHERVGQLETPDWSKGRFKVEVRPGMNDLGVIKIKIADRQ